jgi:mitofusin
VLYHLNCDNLCSDFQEDLAFRFSLGFSCLMGRFMAAGSGQKKRNGHQSYNAPGPYGGFPRQSSYSTPETPSNEFFLPQDEWGLMSKLAIASVSSQGTMGGLLVGGLLFKTVGWRVLAFSGGLYGCVYLYERLTWTNQVVMFVNVMLTLTHDWQAKLKEFKRQYVEHAARKLRLIVDMTSANCSHQVHCTALCSA